MKDAETLDTTVDEWQGAMREAEEASEVEGETIWELAQKLNCSLSTASRRLRKMVSVGTCKRLIGKRRACDGRVLPVSVYQLIPKKEKK